MIDAQCEVIDSFIVNNDLGNIIENENLSG